MVGRPGIDGQRDRPCLPRGERNALERHETLRRLPRFRQAQIDLHHLGPRPVAPVLYGGLQLEDAAFPALGKGR